jgi:cell division protein FtsB
MSTTTGPGPGAPQVPPGGGHGGGPAGGPPPPAPGGRPGTPPPPPPAPPTRGPAPAPGPAAPPRPAPATPAATKAKRRRSSRSRKPGIAGFVADKAIPLLIAVLGLAAALATTYGAIVTGRANDAEATSTRLKRQVADLNETNDSLTTDNSDLEAQVADLNDQVADLERQLTSTEATATSVEGGTSGGGEEPSTGPSGPGDHTATILRQTGDSPVVFSSGYSIDLDSPAPDWGVSPSGGDVEFYLSRGTTPQLSTPEMSVVDHVPTKAECDDATVLRPNFPQDLARVGTQFCTHTYGGQHTAYVHIADINTGTGTITLDIIVWQ